MFEPTLSFVDNQRVQCRDEPQLAIRCRFAYWVLRNAMLEANRRRAQNLTGLEIWFFILGRVLLAFGLVHRLWPMSPLWQPSLCGQALERA